MYFVLFFTHKQCIRKWKMWDFLFKCLPKWRYFLKIYDYCTFMKTSKKVFEIKISSMPFVGLFLTGCLSAYQFFKTFFWLFFGFWFHIADTAHQRGKTLCMLRMFSSGIWCIVYHQLVTWHTCLSHCSCVVWTIFCQTLLCGQDGGKRMKVKYPVTCVDVAWL